MWWTLALVAGVIAWLVLKGRDKPAASQRPAPAPAPPAPALVEPANDVEPLGAVIIGKNLPLPLTLSGITATEARRLAKGLEDGDWSIRGWLTLLIAKKNVRCEEVDAWVAVARPKLDAAIKKAIAESSEWLTASELDRNDMREEFTLTAAEDLSDRPADVDNAFTLLKGEPADHTVDDQLLDQFEGDTQLYGKLLSLFGNPGRVWSSPAGSYDRKDFEALVDKGFVHRGSDIPTEDILAGLTLAQMQQVAGDAAPKKFTRKVAALDLLKSVPDIEQRLSVTISLRELFQLKPVAGLNIEEIAKSYEYAGVLAETIWKTLMAGKSSLETVANAKGYEVDGWELTAGECCPSCAKNDGKSWKRLPKSLPPFHIGCECEIYST